MKSHCHATENISRYLDICLQLSLVRTTNVSESEEFFAGDQRPASLMIDGGDVVAMNIGFFFDVFATGCHSKNPMHRKMHRWLFTSDLNMRLSTIVSERALMTNRSPCPVMPHFMQRRTVSLSRRTRTGVCDPGLILYDGMYGRSLLVSKPLVFVAAASSSSDMPSAARPHIAVVKEPSYECPRLHRVPQ